MKIKLQSLYTSLAHLSKREKLVLYVAVAIIFVTLLDRLIIGPITLRIKLLNKEIEDTQRTIETNSHILAQKDRILAESAKYASFLNSNKSEDEEVTALLKEIEAIANKASVYLVDMKPAPAKEEGATKKYIVTVTCEGQMDQIIDFIYNIESSSKLLVIEKYEISPKSQESSVAVAGMTVSKTIIP
ncbi:MAG: type 4a pilus biogenesis protein PilO [Candidatus Omnitrophica bacterium]|nr:type 4a pilus biogenesis protein PilO [Candidatus Omnitrophota bacterium]